MPSRNGAFTLGALALFVAVLAGVLMPGSGPAPASEIEAATPDLIEIQKLLASDAQNHALFGQSVAVSGDTAIVGTIGKDAVGIVPGAAYVFQRDQGGTENWGEVKKLTAAGGAFGWSVAISGDTAVVGAIFEDSAGENAGAAYVFGRDQGGADNWGEVQRLTASDAEAWDVFGVSVAVSGDTAVVGAQGRDDAGLSDTGAAYVFGRNQGGLDNWGEVTKLTASDPEDRDLFGRSVAVSGDTAFVAARRDDGELYRAGHAYVYGRDEGGADNWGEVKKLTASDPQPAADFGFSLALSGDTVVLGAFRADAGALIFAGAAYIFGRDEGGPDNWGEVTKLTASDAAAWDQIGSSVAISGDRVVIGGGVPIATYLFGRNKGGPGNWGEVTKLIASDADPKADDGFGHSVAVSGDTAVIGALFEDAGGDYLNAGAAYLFALPLPPPPLDFNGTPVFVGGFQTALHPPASSGGNQGLLVAGAVAAGGVALGVTAWGVRRRR